MKEATGELSMTAVVVVVIGILAVALPMIINQVVNTAKRNANCAAAFGCITTTCNENGEGTMQCQYVPEDDPEGGTKNIMCPCSGQK